MWGSADKAVRLLLGKLDTIIADIALLLGVAGPGLRLRFEFSSGGNAERGSRKEFSVSLFDNDTGAGAVPSADIDITGLVQTMEKDTGSGFSSAGITQPTFAKADGLVADTYLFDNAEWAPGDSYRLTFTSIAVTLDADIIDLVGKIWSSGVLEVGDLSSTLDGLVTSSGTAQIDLDTLTDRPKSLSVIARPAININAFTQEITSAAKYTHTRDEVVGVLLRAEGLVSAVANYTFILTLVRGADVYFLASDVIEKPTGITNIEVQMVFNKIVESGDKICSFILSDNAGDTSVDVEQELYEVG